MLRRWLREDTIRGGETAVSPLTLANSKNKLHLIVDVCAVVEDLIEQRVLFDLLAPAQQAQNGTSLHLHVNSHSASENASTLIDDVHARYQFFLDNLCALEEQFGYKVSLVAGHTFFQDVWSRIGAKAYEKFLPAFGPRADEEDCPRQTHDREMSPVPQTAAVLIWNRAAGCDSHLVPTTFFSQGDAVQLHRLMAATTTEMCHRHPNFSFFHCNEGSVRGLVYRAFEAKEVTALKNYTTVLCSSDSALLGIAAHLQSDCILNLCELLRPTETGARRWSAHSELLQTQHHKLARAIRKYCVPVAPPESGRVPSAPVATDFSVPHLCALLAAADAWWMHEVVANRTMQHADGSILRCCAVTPSEGVRAQFIVTAWRLCAQFPELADPSLCRCVPAKLADQWAKAVRQMARDVVAHLDLSEVRCPVPAELTDDEDEDDDKEETEKVWWHAAICAGLSLSPSASVVCTTLVANGVIQSSVAVPAVARAIFGPCTVAAASAAPLRVASVLSATTTVPLPYDALAQRVAQRDALLLALLAPARLAFTQLHRALETSSYPSAATIVAPSSHALRRQQDCALSAPASCSTWCAAFKAFYTQQETSVTSLTTVIASGGGGGGGDRTAHVAALLRQLRVFLPPGLECVPSTLAASPGAAEVVVSDACPLLSESDCAHLHGLAPLGIQASLVALKILWLSGIQSAACVMINAMDLLTVGLAAQSPTRPPSPPHTASAVDTSVTAEMNAIRQWIFTRELLHTLPASCHAAVTALTAPDTALEDRVALSLFVDRAVESCILDPVDTGHRLLASLGFVCDAWLHTADATPTAMRAACPLACLAESATTPPRATTETTSNPPPPSRTVSPHILWRAQSCATAGRDLTARGDPSVLRAALRLPSVVDSEASVPRRVWKPLPDNALSSAAGPRTAHDEGEEAAAIQPDPSRMNTLDVSLPELTRAELAGLHTELTLFTAAADAAADVPCSLDPAARAVLRRIMLIFEELPCFRHAEESWVSAMLFLFGSW